MATKESGKVNEYLEPCLYVEFANGKMVEFTIDTGFNGTLCLPHYFIELLGLEVISEVEIFGVGQHQTVVALAVGRIVWFGVATELEVLINDGDDRLLGSALLAEKVLTINYKKKTLTIK